jgi:predicted nucleotide-binding protein (sugar kinase/HSP70/actin superfamily)
MPKITVPHAGDYYIAFEHFFTKLGYEFIVLPLSTKKTIDLGTKYTPSQSCLPFKLIMGNLFEAIDHSVTRIGMTTGRTGMCRQAYMGEMFKKILNDHGFYPEIVPLKLNSEMWYVIKKDFPTIKLMNYIKYFYEFWKKMRLIEILREQCLVHRAKEKDRGGCTKLYQRFLKEIRSCKTVSEMRKLKKEILSQFQKLPKDEAKKTIDISVVGEFFLQIDPFSVSNMETILGEQGVVLRFSETFSTFFLGAIRQIRFFDHFLPTERHRISRLARPYINRPIGGHALQTIGHAIEYMNKGTEGIILIYPFTCMPEIAANAILPAICRARRVPLLTLCFDEQTGAEGLKTRLEAFVDLIYRRKNQNIN